jgi:hypothetical protein
VALSAGQTVRRRHRPIAWLRPRGHATGPASRPSPQALEAEVETAPVDRRQVLRHQLTSTAARLDAAKSAAMAEVEERSADIRADFEAS